jgi:hypothetical protein
MRVRIQVCSLTELKFGAHFDQLLRPGNLPIGLTHLGVLFNQPIELSVLPVGLTSLTLSNKLISTICVTFYTRY